ncbi:hypothetical protein HAL_36390 [Haladaptatus sp. T7]|nr:hypothetical protein HAL_36390 [Haladaptatus sp. T7]
MDSNLSEEPPSDQDTHTDVEHDNRKQFRRDERDEQSGQYHSEAHPERERNRRRGEYGSRPAVRPSHIPALEVNRRTGDERLFYPSTADSPGNRRRNSRSAVTLR